MRRSAVWSLIVLAFQGAALAATLKPASVAQFFVTPGETSHLQWKATSSTLKAPVEYRLLDYAGKPTASGRATLNGAGVVEVTVQLQQGYFEIEFPATRERFGVVALPPWQGKADPFFSIDGALSWLVRDDAVREGLIQAARRSGIAMIRERLTWGAIHPAAERWDWEGGVRFDTLRRTCAKHGVEVLEMAHDGPAWMGRVAKYPENLVAAARSWRRIADQWRTTWRGLEVWNEPDIFFGGNLPADQYVPLVKAISFGLREGKFNVPVVGGVMAHCNRAFLDTAARNGILDYVDVFSFHTYGRAPEMEGLVEKYRSWLKDHGHPGMPLWLTECGRPWKSGPDRPPVDQDAESALDITMKAVESKACGIARFFAFVYPFYEEGRNNFGMMDREATPLRSFAAYAQMARVLGGRNYLGDLTQSDPAIQRARVFFGDREAVAVLYTGRVDSAAAVKIGLPVQRIEGIDGRRLEPGGDGAIPVPDGMVYVWLDRKKLGDRLDAKTKATALWEVAGKPGPSRSDPSPIILRFQRDDKLLQATSEGYRFRADPPNGMPIAVRVFNLGGKPQDLTLRLGFAEDKARVAGPAVRPIRVPAEGFADVAWEAELAAAFAADGQLRVSVTANSPGERSSVLDFVLFRRTASK